MSLHIVILAAGQGKRMYSVTPKVLHPLAGKPMLERVIETAMQLNPAAIYVIVGHAHEQIRQHLAHLPVQWINQDKQLGTGHAVLQALPLIPPEAQVLVLSGDVPLIQSITLQHLITHCQPPLQGLAPLGLLLACVPDPTGLGRIIRDDAQQICAIVEEKDASELERQINEVYSGICCTSANHLHRWLPMLTNHNAQQEYYLTEIIALAVAEKIAIVSIQAPHNYEIQGINTRVQLEQLERVWQHRQAVALLEAGITLADAHRIDIRGELHCGQDVYIDVNNVFTGQVHIGKNSHIGSNCVINNATIGENCTVLPNSVLDNCHIDDHCQIGPFARLRPGTRLAAHCKVGNFVETKNAVLGCGSKANHLSYLGDTTIGCDVNIGAGTITCNYDGANKHQTVIGDGVNIGSDTQLVAPVTIGDYATIGAGSTIRKNAPAGELTLTVSTQKTVVGWKRKQKHASEKV